jgi:phosphotransferase system enzyme I (PtsI)
MRAIHRRITLKKDTSKKKRVVLKGTGISPGYATGKAFIYKDILNREHFTGVIAHADFNKEYARITAAAKGVMEELDDLRDSVKDHLGEDKAEIFDAQKAILNDKTLLNKLRDFMRQNSCNAENVVKEVFSSLAARMRSSDNVITRNSAEDVEDVGRKLLKRLLGYGTNVLEGLPENSIVIARSLLPSDTVHLKGANANGFIVEQGSRNAHSAIIARTLGIPAVSDTGSRVDDFNEGTELIIDGGNGTVIIEPDSEDKIKFKERRLHIEQRNKKMMEFASKDAVTADGTKISVYANVASSKDVLTAMDFGCDGIGLVRIENFYFQSGNIPKESELLSYLNDSLAGAEGTLTIRLLDVGGDKRLPYLGGSGETVHSMGMRGVRLLLQHEELLISQIRAVLRMGEEKKVRILIPMVTLPEEIKKVREIFERSREELQKEKRKKYDKIQLGTMVETPAAVLNINAIVKFSDFLSIGTNDLIQYTMAAGREDKNVAHYYEEGAKLIIRSIRKITGAAKEHNIECTLCGEIAGNLSMTESLLKAGVESFSVAPYLIPQLKYKVRTVNLK